LICSTNYQIIHDSLESNPDSNTSLTLCVCREFYLWWGSEVT